MIAYPPVGAFPDGTVPYQASPTLWTSRMFPLLEPYTEQHRAFFLSKIWAAVPDVRDKLFILLRDFKYVWRTDDGVWRSFLVPAGFVTDIASIPLLIQLLFRMSSDGKIRTAALAHDPLYQLKEMLADVPAMHFWQPAFSVRLGLTDPDHKIVYTGSWVRDPRPWTKAAADKFFAKIMKAYGVRLSTLTYKGVRGGGHLAYHRNDDTRFYTAALYDVSFETRNSWRLE